MDHSEDSENQIMHSILCVKLEPFDEDEDCTQNLDPLQPGSNVHTQIELLHDFKMEIETDGSDQAMNQLIEEDILKYDPSDTGTIIEEIKIKTEYIGNEASIMVHVLDSHGIIEDDTNTQNHHGESSRYSEHRCTEINNQTTEKPTTSYEIRHSKEPCRSDAINEELMNDTNALHATSPDNHSRASSDTSSSGVKDFSIHSTSEDSSEDEGSEESSPLSAHSLPRSSYVSDVCDMTFKNSRDFAKDKVVHTGQKPYSCDICKKGFNNASNLFTHKRIHSGEKPYVCDICKKGFSQSSTLATHKRIHTGQKPYICDICKKGFSQLSNLIRHKHMHTGQKPYICDICEKGFISSSHLLTHKRIHTGQKPYICDICKKSFINSSNLLTHKRIHTGQKPYICDICKKRFISSSNLLTHKRIHTGQKPYICEICKKSFNRSSSLVRHKRTQHGQKSCAGPV